jgi:carbon storage regulator
MMLVLTRKVGESVVLPKALVRITVTRIDGNRVKLGIESPHGVDVYREELLDELVRIGDEDEKRGGDDDRR